MLSKKVLLSGAVLVSVAALSACAPKPAPPPKLVAPPPPVAVTPRKPYPPLGAAPNLTTPPVDANGVRQTVNIGLSPDQTLWNLRSAYNVAALSCVKPKDAPILAGYRKFLKTYKKTLAAANRALDRHYRAENGSHYVQARESYQTRVYNYFALPPTLPAFCNAVLAMSEQAQTVKPADLDAYAARSLHQLDAVFDSFFDRYDQYRKDLANWEARYGAGYQEQRYGPIAESPTSQSLAQ